jgi:hypothetical protein
MSTGIDVRSLPCPHCGSANSPLNATLVSEVMSFIFLTHLRRQVVIGCPACLDKAIQRAQVRTLLLGWWGIPFGIFRTVGAVAGNIKHKQQLRHATGPTEVLESFVRSNAAQLIMRKEHPRALQNLIKNP